MDKKFWDAGHRQSLLAAFFCFDPAFMVRGVPGQLRVQIVRDFGLSHASRRSALGCHNWAMATERRSPGKVNETASCSFRHRAFLGRH